MPRTLIAQTNEVDEADLAMIDLMAQLDLDNNLLANSVGLLFGDLDQFHPDLLSALSSRLPFDLIGINSSLSSGPSQKEDYYLLNLMVLTSDDLNIMAALSEDIGQAGLDSIDALYRDLASRMTGRPKLILMFGSRQSGNFRAGRAVSRLDAISGGTPIFGCLSGDFDSIDSKGFLVHNGQKYMDRFAIVMIDGPIKPKFSIFRVPENKRLKHKAIITSCSGNLIKEINGLPALDYLSGLGFIIDQKVGFSATIPMIVENHQADFWSPMVLVSRTDCNYVVCSQDVEVNSTLGLGGLDETDVLKSAGELADELKWEQFGFCLIHSCQARHLSLGLDYLGEIERMRSSLSDLLPYTLSYTGGEICPCPDKRNKLTNSYHSMSLSCLRF
ncbi:MAG: hypothetical protein LBP92_06870 [Deltaproteobacteria bacterium]|jgi:hypothetical protein|nr:hypothetical protein [Deltaproteobacteria bacterium]